MTDQNRFEYEGKKYTAEPSNYVRLPSGVVLKVTVVDADGTATVVVSNKRNVDAVPASEIADPPAEDVASGPTPPSPKPSPEDETRARIAVLKEKWVEGMAAVKAKEDEAAALRESLRDGVETAIAESLLSLSKKKGDQPHKVKLGDIRYKAQRSRDKSEPPTLALVPAWWPDEGTL